MYSFRK